MPGPELPHPIRPALPADADALADLARRTFIDTFAADNRPEDMAEHVTQAFSTARQLAEIVAADVRTLLAVRDGAPTAFAQLRTSDPPPCVTTPGPVELWRFYVDRPWHGRGVAQSLMSAVLREAASLGAGSLWLGVWERNLRAAAFYRRFGFVAVGSHEFRLGRDRQRDLVLVRCPVGAPDDRTAPA